MNNERRRILTQKVKELKTIIRDVERVLNDEQSAFDSLPDAIMDSVRGQEMEDNVCELEDAVGHLQDAVGAIDRVL